MMSNLIEKMKATIAVKTAGKMDFKSESAETNFELIRENNPGSAEFVEDWARLMQVKMSKRRQGAQEEEKISQSVLWDTYRIVEACHKTGVDLHQARALLTRYWKFGDKLIPFKESA